MERHRIASWWIRWEDLNWPNQDNLDKIKARAEAFAKADVSAAMIFGTHFRWDFLPVFPLLHDYMAAVVEEVHKYGIKLFDHHSVNLVHRYSTREEMRSVMLDSGPHLPFSPTFEAAATWEYKGKRLNDWRMIDVKTRTPMYFPQYTAQCFCHRNPEYKEAYQDYVKQLILDTNIDGLSADDGVHYLRFNTCGCEHCRAELQRRSGIDLPPVEDQSFWGNWDNPAWLDWCDIRLDSNGEFYRDLSAVLPEGFMLTGCGTNSASARATAMGSDARRFLDGCNYVNMEMSGNTPPYKHDPKTVNVAVKDRLTNASHHQAAARERGVTAFCTGFAHTTVAANHVWAVSKMLGADAWIIALKARLGLPDHILNTLPNEEDVVGCAFGFEKQHPDLFQGDCVGQLGVYFSNETRNHALFGNIEHGFPEDFSTTLTLLFREGICPHTVFAFPENADTYPLILLCGVARMTQEEIAGMDRYLAAGGKVIITGPTPLPDCKNSWDLPNKVCCEPDAFFDTVPDGIHLENAAWRSAIKLAPSQDPNVWTQPREGLFYNPHRVVDGANNQQLLELCRRYMKKTPIQILQSEGYLISMFTTEDQITVQFLAEDYDVDIDHELDDMRYHRSRVNFVNKAEPIGVSPVIRMTAPVEPQVFTPFQDVASKVKMEKDVCTITIPEKCSYALVCFKLRP